METRPRVDKNRGDKLEENRADVARWQDRPGGSAFKYSERSSTYLPVSLKNKITVHNSGADGAEII